MKWLKNYNGFKSINESIEIDSLCEKYGIKNYTINPDGTIDVDGEVKLNNLGFEKLPLRFGRVTGTFMCENNNLTTLEGCPNFVGGNFYCRHNKLKDLVGGPEVVGLTYMAVFNQIETLEGCNLRECGQVFALGHNKLKNLVGCPRGINDYDFGDNELISLEGSPEKVTRNFCASFNNLKSLVGSPRIVGGRFDCSNNRINSLVGGPEECGIYAVNNNKLTDLVGAAHSCDTFICANNQLETLKGDIKYVRDLFLFSGNQVTIINFEDIEFLECSKFEAIDDFGSGFNPIHNIMCLFKDFKDFKYSLEFNYLRQPNIIDRMRFSDACQDAGIEMPERIEGYIFE
jgi:hypothetical protein